MWTAEPFYFFHFPTVKGVVSVFMERVLWRFEKRLDGVPGTTQLSDGGSMVPGFQCGSCREVFIAATLEGIRHGCMGSGGLISGRV